MPQQAVFSTSLMNQPFDAVVTKALRSATPSSGDNLLGFDIDLCYALIHANYFSHIRTKRTGDQRNMIVATCRLKLKYKKNLQIEETLLKLWQEQVAYYYFKAHDIQQDRDHITLRFVTLSGNTSKDLCVTGSISFQALLCHDPQRNRAGMSFE